MPIIPDSSYKRKPFYLINEHFETIYPSVWRKVQINPYSRERLELDDGDFLDLDWLKNDSTQCVIVSHGLEGNSSRPYVLGMAKIFNENNWDVVAWNYRSCGEEMRR